MIQSFFYIYIFIGSSLDPVSRGTGLVEMVTCVHFLLRVEALDLIQTHIYLYYYLSSFYFLS